MWKNPKRFSLLFVTSLFILLGFYSNQTFASQANEYQQVGLPLVQYYDQDDFNAHVHNWAVKQGRDGRIYVGNGNGLLSWDGEQWRRYSMPNQSRIRSLLEWKDGRFYVGTVNDIGYYAADGKGRMTFTSLLEANAGYSSLFGETWSIAATDEFIVFKTDKQTFVYDGESLQTIEDAESGAGRLFNLDGHIVLFPDERQAAEIQPANSQPYQPLPIPGLPSGIKVRDILDGSDGQRLIVTSRHGVFSWTNSGAEQILTPAQLGTDIDIYTGFRASDGYYYLGSRRNGLFILNPDFKLLRRYGRKDGTGMDTVFDINEDSQGGIWFSGMPGVGRMMPAHLYSDYGSKQQNIGSPNLQGWRGEPMLAAFSIYQLSPSAELLNSPAFKPLQNWQQDSNFVLDLGEEALVAATGGVFQLPVSPTGKLLPDDAQNVLQEVMFAFHLILAPADSPTSQPTVYAATSDGLYRLVKSQGNWQSERVSGIDETLRYLAFDKQENLWIGTTNQRLFLLSKDSLANMQSKPVLFDVNNGLGPNYVYPIAMEDGFYFGTANGLFDYDPDRKPEFQAATGFPELFHTEAEDFFRWLIDSNDNFWFRIGNHTGVAWKQADGSYIADEQITEPLPFRSATGFFETNDGAMLISQADGGVYRLGPDLVSGSMAAAPALGRLAITEINNLGHGELLYGGYGDVQIPQLPAESASLRIRFALNDYSLPGKTLYSSRLSGSDNWSEWRRETWRDFTRLQGGEYQFELRARDGWGREQSLQTFSFRILPPWYLGPLAWTLYAVALMLALLLAAWLGQRMRTVRLQQRNLDLQQVVQERTHEVQAKVDELQQQQELKDRFFANVSHEFRTPLTLTIEPLEEVVRTHSEGLDDQGKGLTEIALRNARKMLALIGQVLDINRLDAGRLKLLVAEYDLADLMQRIAQRFQPWVQRQQQTLVLQHADDPLRLWYDEDQMDRIVSNLLSNAIKYSGTGSQIEIALLADEDSIDIVVSDNGPGIPENQHTKIFERYFQGESSSEHVWPGTGIGLALVRELVDLHHGNIELEPSARGAVFRLQLLRGNHHFNQEDLNRDGVTSTTKVPANDESPAELLESPRGEDVTTVLIVDDNAELRHFLGLRLASRYRVIEAGNGREGVETAINELPDLVISDVMMPEMNGIELAQALSENPDTATIPLILLTAKSTKRDTVEGLQAGADDYLTKPFDTSELIARVAGLIASRKLVRVAALAEFQADNSKPGVNKFIDRLDQVILEHLNDTSLSVNRLAELLSMDRTSLYRKCQSNCQVSPVVYLRKQRMQVAGRLLRETEMSVSEVAYATGFESISYFSRIFRGEYKTTPSAYSNAA